MKPPPIPPQGGQLARIATCLAERKRSSSISPTMIPSTKRFINATGSFSKPHSPHYGGGKELRQVVFSDHVISHSPPPMSPNSTASIDVIPSSIYETSTSSSTANMNLSERISSDITTGAYYSKQDPVLEEGTENVDSLTVGLEYGGGEQITWKNKPEQRQKKLKFPAMSPTFDGLS